MFFQLQEMEKSPANHFLILFRDSSCQFRGVYTMNPDTQELARLAGVGPRTVSSIQVESIYKYSSDRKQFSAIPSKTMGMSVDAFTIPSHLWQGGGAGGGGSRRASVTKKAVTSKWDPVHTVAHGWWKHSKYTVITVKLKWNTKNIRAHWQACKKHLTSVGLRFYKK